MSEIFSGLEGGLVATALEHLEGPVQPDRDGKSRLRAGLAVWLTLLVVCGVTGVFIYMLVFLGPERTDWGDRTYLFVLVGAGAVAVGTLSWFSFARVIRWDETSVEVQRRFGAGNARPRLPVVHLSRNSFLGYCRVDFADGYRLRFSYLLRGAHEFIRYLARIHDSRIRSSR